MNIYDQLSDKHLLIENKHYVKYLVVIDKSFLQDHIISITAIAIVSVELFAKL